MPVIVAGAIVCPASASAASAPPMTVSITSASGSVGNYFKLSGRPGQASRAGSVDLRNQTRHSVTVMLDPVRGLTASTLGSAYGLHGTEAIGPSSWVRVRQRRVVLAPRGGARVPVTVDVPSGAKPGDYLAGISVEAVSSPDQVQLKGSVAISSVQRYAVGLVTRVPGPRHPSIKLTGVDLKREPAGVTFYLHARNAGNVILQNVRGAATISEAGNVVARRSLGPGTFVTATSIAYPILVPSLTPQQGTKFEVSAVVRYPGGVARIDRTVTFGPGDAKRQQAYGGPAVSKGGGDSLPLIALIAAVAILAAAIAYLAWRRRSGEGALRRRLPREIAHARESGEPLSVIGIPAGDPGLPRKLTASVKSCLRPRDRLYRLNGSGMMVVSPDTSPQAAELLATEIRRQLARAGRRQVAVTPITSAAETSSEELLEAVAAGAETGTPGNGSNGTGGNQSGQSEVKRSGTEASAVGDADGSHRSA